MLPSTSASATIPPAFDPQVTYTSGLISERRTGIGLLFVVRADTSCCVLWAGDELLGGVKTIARFGGHHSGNIGGSCLGTGGGNKQQQQQQQSRCPFQAWCFAWWMRGPPVCRRGRQRNDSWRVVKRGLDITSHPSHLTPHASHLTPHTSHLTPHTSHLTPHISHLTPHAFTRQRPRRRRRRPPLPPPIFRRAADSRRRICSTGGGGNANAVNVTDPSLSARGRR